MISQLSLWIWHPTGIWLLIFLRLLWWDSSYMSSDSLNMQCILQQLWHLSWTGSRCFYFPDLFIIRKCLWISVPAGALPAVYMGHLIPVEQQECDFTPGPGTMGLPWPLALASLSTPPPLFLSCLHSEICASGILFYIACVSLTVGFSVVQYNSFVFNATLNTEYVRWTLYCMVGLFQHWQLQAPQNCH